MTEHTPPAKSHLEGPHDKHGHPVKKGQVAEFVWAGEHHVGIIRHIETDDHGHHYAFVTIDTKVPCTACSVRADQNPTDAEKDGSKVEHKPARKETK